MSKGRIESEHSRTVASLTEDGLTIEDLYSLGSSLELGGELIDFAVYHSNGHLFNAADNPMAVCSYVSPSSLGLLLNLMAQDKLNGGLDVGCCQGASVQPHNLACQLVLPTS